jgi:sugar/nucleoside kinase (ribokinase family)
MVVTTMTTSSIGVHIIPEQGGRQGRWRQNGQSSLTQTPSTQYQTPMAGDSRNAQAASPSMVALGDMVYDVVVQGALDRTGEAAGAVSIHAGGSAANFAVGAARGGAQVRFVGRVGDDAAGRLLVTELERAGVVPCVVVAADVPTGYVLVLQNVDGCGGNRMLSEAGANSGLSPDGLDPTWFEAVEALHLTGYSFLRGGSTARSALRALELTRQRAPEALCVMDPGPAHLIEDYPPLPFLQLLERQRFDVLLPNLDEGRVLTGLHEPLRVVARLAEVAGVVVLTLGGDGCLVAAAGRVEEVPAAPVRQVLDSTGAGDSFAAAFVCEYLRSRDATTAAQRGTQAAALVVERVGPRL